MGAVIVHFVYMQLLWMPGKRNTKYSFVKQYTCTFWWHWTRPRNRSITAYSQTLKERITNTLSTCTPKNSEAVKGSIMFSMDTLRRHLIFAAIQQHHNQLGRRRKEQWLVWVLPYFCKSLDLVVYDQLMVGLLTERLNWQTDQTNNQFQS